MDTLEIRRRLSDHNLAAVARATGLHHATVWKFYTGKTKRVSEEVAGKLRAYLDAAKKV